MESLGWAEATAAPEEAAAVRMVGEVRRVAGA